MIVQFPEEKCMVADRHFSKSTFFFREQIFGTLIENREKGFVM